MLVLTRRPGESIVVGEDIVITVIEIKGGQVRIGIDAPRSVEVYREEIYEQVRQENLSAIANVEKIREAVQDAPKDPG
ncbi:MAG: carbon storage regulator CsrA [Acidimicrobiia bacterium]|nr:carbon storage regulator CsrA [Acidimicrobiia bacterium]MDJ0664286.1 carbon storage regulator CsrA [Acidimicrobiia bacterium]